MEYNAKTTIITIDQKDSLYDYALNYFKQKKPQEVIFSSRNIIPFLEYLSTNNNRTIEFLLAIGELVLIQVQNGRSTDEYKLQQQRLAMIKSAYEFAKITASEQAKNSNTKKLIFLIDKDPTKTLDSIASTVIAEAQRLTDYKPEQKKHIPAAARPAGHEQPTSKPKSKKQLPQYNFKNMPELEDVIDDIPELTVVRDDENQTSAKRKSTVSKNPDYVHDSSQSYTRNMGVKYNRQPPPKQTKQEIDTEDNNGDMTEETSEATAITTSKKQKYFSHEKIIALMQSITNAKTRTGDIEVDMQSSRIISTNEVAFTTQKMFATIIAGKPKLTYQDLKESIQRNNTIADANKTTSNILSRFGWMGSVAKKINEVVTNGVTAAAEVLDGKSMLEHKSNTRLWVENKTTTGRAIAGLLQMTKETNKKLGPLGFIFSPGDYFKNSDALSLVLRLRNKQRVSRNERNGTEEIKWKKTIDKYKRYADELLKNPLLQESQDKPLTKENAVIKTKILNAMNRLDGYENLSWNNIQGDLIDRTNKAIEDLMDAGAELEAAEVSYRPSNAFS